MGLGVPASDPGRSTVLRAMGVDIDPAVYTVEQAKAARSAPPGGSERGRK